MIYTKGLRHFINKNDRTKKSLIGHPGINKASSSTLDIEKQFFRPRKLLLMR